eukprot:TRINITY_DN15779_c0_g1_i1.p1 TRINITY_DN15779_c0_g1~~TRINITY_DN15779_c0_g1_i1.p1  ORF type:complete len:347 (+),score=96.30 TRINITY_DN15779_c0_g1_i1:80-1120(+)
MENNYCDDLSDFEDFVVTPKVIINTPHGKEGTPRIGKYKIGNEIGSGSYGVVNEGFTPRNDSKVAIKAITKKNKTTYASAKRELTILDMLNDNARISEQLTSENKNDLKNINVEENCDHILKIYDKIETNETVYVVMEYVGEDLLAVLLEQEDCRFSEEYTGKLFVQLVSAVKFLHSIFIIHNDIKPDNVLITDDGKVKLCDYGLSRKYNKNQKQLAFPGTLQYASPESIQNQYIYGPEVDLWALGVTLYVFYTGLFPFCGDDDCEIIESILEDDYVPNDNIPPEAVSLLDGLLDKNPETRFTIEQVEQHYIYKFYCGNASPKTTRKSKKASKFFKKLLKLKNKDK